MEIFDPFFKFIAGVLSFFYSVVPSYGLSIILLTVTVMVVITPLTYKSTKSMLQMQRLQPELKRIQAQYKDDRERLNQELMAFYKEHNLNPLGGCLPLFIQAPVFIVLYRVLHGLTTRFGGAGSGAGHIVGQLYPPASTLTPWRITDQPFNPTYVNTSSDLYRSLSNHSKMNFLGIDLSLTPIQAFKIGVWTAIPFVILIALMTGAQVIQNRQIQGRNKNQTTSAQQQAIMKFLPFMLPVISLNFPAGLGIYYLFQSLSRIGTQGYITRRLRRPCNGGGGVDHGHRRRRIGQRQRQLPLGRHEDHLQIGWEERKRRCRDWWEREADGARQADAGKAGLERPQPGSPTEDKRRRIAEAGRTKVGHGPAVEES